MANPSKPNQTYIYPLFTRASTGLKSVIGNDNASERRDLVRKAEYNLQANGTPIGLTRQWIIEYDTGDGFSNPTKAMKQMANTSRPETPPTKAKAPRTTPTIKRKLEDTGAQEPQAELTAHPFKSEVLGSFLAHVKKQTNRDVSAKDAVFHRSYAKYRHMPYPDVAEDEWKSDFMQRTWINVLLHDGMTDELRQELYPGRFDLGNNQSDSRATADLGELLREINGVKKTGRGENVGGVQKKDLGTVLRGIESVIQRRLGDSSEKLIAGDLKVIKLLYRLTKGRPGHLFGLIAPPADNASVDFGEAYRDRQLDEPTLNDIRIEENELLVADLIAYLSVEIPETTLKAIHVQLLNYSKLLEAIVIENDEILLPIRAVSQTIESDPAPAYFFLAQIIDLYPNIEPATRPNACDEALYTYLRSLHFRHFVGGYADIVEKAMIAEEIKPIRLEMERFCNELAEANMIPVDLNTPIISIEEFPELVKRQSNRFKSLIKSATGLATRDDALNDICSHASKILNAYMWVQFQEKDLRKECISVADCLASLIAIRHQQSVKTNYKPRWFGLTDVGASPLRYFDRERSVTDLQATDYIPEGVNQLLYQRFCQIHLLLIGNQDRHDSWMLFQLARLRQYALCMQSNNISGISHSINHLNDFCSNISELVAKRILISAQ